MSWDQGQGQRMSSHRQAQQPVAPQQVFIIVRPPPSKGVDLRNLQIQLVNTTRPVPTHQGQVKASRTGAPIPTPPPHPLGKATSEKNHGGSDRIGSEAHGQGRSSSDPRRPWSTGESTSTSTLGGKSFDAVAGATIDSYDLAIGEGQTTDPSSPRLTTPTAPRPSRPASTEMIRSPSWQSDQSCSSAISKRSSLVSSIGSSGTSYSIGASSVGTNASASASMGRRDRSGRGSSKRRVTPLYNLGFHALLQTVVTDAGTDEKIAKFSKRGTIEMMDFALLEPIDLRAPPAISNISATTTMTSPLALMRSRVRSEETGTNGGPSVGTGGLMSKLRRIGLGKAASKGNGGGGNGATLAPRTLSSRASTSDPRTNLTPPDQAVTIVVAPPRKLARGHAFTVSRFLRNDLVEAREATGVVVRFEWKRVEKKRMGARNQSRSKSPMKEGSEQTTGKDGEGSSSPEVEAGRSRLELPLERGSSRRGSADAASSSVVSVGSSRASGELDRGTREFEGSALPSEGLVEDHVEQEHDDEHEEEEEEEDSDLEDSDRPWACTLYITHLNSAKVPSNRSSEPWSLPLAHLIPAPHHPRLVANLSFSPSLAEVRLLGEGARLSEEDLKDVASVTALWIVAREGLGGGGGSGSGGLKVALRGKGRKGSVGAG